MEKEESSSSFYSAAGGKEEEEEEEEEELRAVQVEEEEEEEAEEVLQPRRSASRVGRRKEEEEEEDGMDASVDLTDEDQVLLSKGDRLQRKRAEVGGWVGGLNWSPVSLSLLCIYPFIYLSINPFTLTSRPPTHLFPQVERLFACTRDYTTYLQTGWSVDVLELPPTHPPSCPLLFLPCKMHLEGILPPTPPPSSSLQPPTHPSLVKARLVWSPPKPHKKNFLSSFLPGKVRTHPPTHLLSLSSLFYLLLLLTLFSPTQTNIQKNRPPTHPPTSPPRTPSTSPRSTTSHEGCGASAPSHPPSSP